MRRRTSKRTVTAIVIFAVSAAIMGIFGNRIDDFLTHRGTTLFENSNISPSTLLILTFSVFLISTPIIVTFNRYKSSISSFLLGVLTADIPTDPTNKILSYLKDRALGRTITLEIKADGREIKIEYRSKEELDAALESVERLISITRETKEEDN